MCVCPYLYVHHVSAVPEKVRREYQILPGTGVTNGVS